MTDRPKQYSGLTAPAPPRTVQIDTSLIIEQQKSEEEAKPVRDALSRYIFRGSSTFGRKEFKRAWLQDLALLHKLAKGAKDLGELLRKVETSLGKVEARRRRSRCVSAISAFLSRHSGTSGDLPVGVLMVPRTRL